MRSIRDIVKSDKGSKDRSPLSSFVRDHDEDVRFISTNSLALNLLYSGRVNGGIPMGRMSMISAPSMLGKTVISMSLARSAQKSGMSVVVIDTERAFQRSMAESFGIDMSPDKFILFQDNQIENIESMIVSISSEMTKEEKDNTLFILDSWGTLVTSKTLKDSMNGNDVLDMTDPKKKNKLSNQILNTQLTFFIINHVYDNIGGFGDAQSIPGGRKIIFNCDAIVMGMSRAKDKDKTTGDIDGYIITARTYKSRYCKGDSKLQYRIRTTGGLDPYYGLLDDAIECGVVIKPSNGRYSRAHIENDEKFHEKNIYNADFWGPIFKDTKFKAWLEEKYTFTADAIAVADTDTLDEIFS